MTATDTPLLDAAGIRWRIGDRAILEDIDVALHGGEMVGIIGPNGAGKSSLLKILAGINRPDAGTLRLRGQDYGAVAPRAFACRVGYLEQKGPVYWPLAVSTVVALGRLPHQGRGGRLRDADRAAVERAVAATGIDPLLQRTVSGLSEGERMLVALTRVLATEPDAILADEPVASLDPNHQLMIMELLRARCRGAAGAVVVLHDLGHAARYCDRLLLIDRGRVVAAGAPETVLSRDNLARYYKIDAHIDFDKHIVQPLGRIG